MQTQPRKSDVDSTPDPATTVFVMRGSGVRVPPAAPLKSHGFPRQFADFYRCSLVPDEPKPPCERCGGSGKVWSFVYRSTLIKCPKCRGTGRSQLVREAARP